MKKRAKHLLGSVAVFLIVGVLSVSAGEPPFSGFLGGPEEYAKLSAGPEGGVRLRWLKSAQPVQHYDRFMVDSVIFFLAPGHGAHGIDPNEMKELADEFNSCLVAAFRDHYPIVADPGPGVARIRIAITNLQPSKPGVSAVTSIIPAGLGVSLIRKGASGGWSGGGKTGIEMVAMDSVTEEVLAMAVDQQSAGFSERFSRWGSATEAFRFWSQRIVEFIDHTRTVRP